MGALIGDCRHALRLYWRTPVSSLIAVVVLAVGVAFVIAFLSLYVDLVLKPHPGFQDSDRLATVGQTGGNQLVGLPFTVVQRMTDEMSSVEAVAASQPARVLIGPDREAGGIELVSAQFFDGLRPRLALGRGFLPEEHRLDAEPVAVISHRLWLSRFDGRTDILGTLLEVSRDPGFSYTVAEPFEFGDRSGFMITPGEPDQETTQFRIVGVMAEPLRGLAQAETALWVPLERAYSLYVGSDRLLYGLTSPRTYVRRHEGVHTTAVRNEVDSRYADESLNSLLRLDAIDGVVRDIDVQRDANRQLGMFLAGSIMLALVAAANVSLFLLARAPSRRRELGIRMALGAPIGRLARQLASEAGLLVVGATVLGLLLSTWLSAFLRGLTLLRDAEWHRVSLSDWRVLAMTTVFLLTVALLVALAPIVGLKRLGIAESSRQVASRASMAQRLAGTAQIAVAGAFAAAAIAFGWHLGSLMFGNPGYELTNRHLARFEITEAGIRDSNNAYVSAVRLRQIIETIPGVTAVAIGSSVPGEEQGRYIARIPDPTDQANQIDARWTMIDSQYIATVGLKLLHGRAPADSERDVVLVNQTLARTWWGREDVVGEPLPFSIPYTNEGSHIIGVLADLSFEHPSAAAVPRVFTTSTFLSASYSAVIIESSLTPAALQQQLSRLASGGDIEIEVRSVQPLEMLRADLIAPDRARGFLTIATASLVLFLSAFGFYGTQRYLVAAGRREYAIRAALGAGPKALGRLVIMRGVGLGVPGIVTGGLLAFIVAAWLRGDFVARGVSPGVVTTWVVLGLTLLLIAASLAPAREARRTQPAPLLGEE